MKSSFDTNCSDWIWCFRKVSVETSFLLDSTRDEWCLDLITNQCNWVFDQHFIGIQGTIVTMTTWMCSCLDDLTYPSLTSAKFHRPLNRSLGMCGKDTLPLVGTRIYLPWLTNQTPLRVLPAMHTSSSFSHCQRFTSAGPPWLTTLGVLGALSDSGEGAWDCACTSKGCTPMFKFKSETTRGKSTPIGSTCSRFFHNFSVGITHLCPSSPSVHCSGGWSQLRGLMENPTLTSFSYGLWQLCLP